MKKTNLYIAAMALMLGGTLAACSDDIEQYTVSGLEASQFSTAESEVVIDESNLDSPVLTLVYNKSNLLINGASDVQSNLNGGYIVLQASATADFANYVEFDGTNLESVSGSSLNSVATSLGLTPNTANTMYLRLATSYGANSEDVLTSNVVSLNVTPFLLDSHWAYLYMSSDDDVTESELSTTYLYSTNDDGNYAGFVNACAWQKIVISYDGAYYATGLKQTQVDATGWSFLYLDRYENISDCHTWFAGLAGCYYFQADLKSPDTQANLYLISSFTCGGDCSQATMVFDNTTNSWSAFIQVTKDDATVTVTGKAAHYSNQNSSDGDVDCGFSGSNGRSTFSIGVSGTGLTGISKGTYKLTIDVSKNSSYKYTLEPAEIVVYPAAMTVNGVAMDTEMLDGAATGVYTTFAKLTAGDAKFVDGDGETKDVTSNIEKDGWYMVTLDLAKETATPVLYGNTLTVSDAWTGTLTMNDNGKYTGLLTNGTGWNFKLADENGIAYGTYNGWDQFTFGPSVDDYDHNWVNNAYGDVYVEIDPYDHSWTFAYENALVIVKKECAINHNGEGIIATLAKNGDVFKGVYDRTAETDAGWNYYFQGMNSTKDGITYYGCDDNWSTPSADENYANIVVAREFSDAYSNHTFWVDPTGSYNMTIDLTNGTVAFSKIVTPTALAIYANDKETKVCDLTVSATDSNVFTGTFQLSADNGWNFYIKGTVDGSDDVVWYGSDGTSDSELNVSTGIAMGGEKNLWCNYEKSWTVSVSLKDMKITWAEATAK